MAAAVDVATPRRHLIAGNLPEFRRDRLAFLEACARAGRDLVPLRFGVFRAVFVNSPSAIELVLGNSRDFVKSFAYQMIRPVVANGLLLSEGDFWLRQRRLAQPVFQRARLIDAYLPVIVKKTREMLARWASGEVRDVHADMIRLTSQVAGEAFFGADVSDAAVDVSHQLLVLGELLTHRLDSLLAFLPDALPTPANLKVRRAVKRLDALIFRIIEERRTSPQLRDDLLSRLLAAQDDDGSRMTNRQLRDEVMTFFLAGHETTSLLLSWTLYCLSRDPDRQQALRAKVAGHTPSVAELTALPELDAVLCESLRLYPPVWAMGRKALVDLELAGQPIAKGTSLLFSQWVMHRDQRFFENPESFVPERWLNGLQKRLPRYAYFPFGGGQRICIGANFAMLEAAVILAMVLERFRVEPAPDAQVEVWPAFTLRPKTGVPLTINPAA